MYLWFLSVVNTEKPTKINDLENNFKIDILSQGVMYKPFPIKKKSLLKIHIIQYGFQK